MAKRKSDKEPSKRAPVKDAPASAPPDDEGAQKEPSEPNVGEDDLVLAAREGEGEDLLARIGEGDAESTALAEGEEDLAPTQLGTQRYVLAGFFAAAMLGAYVLGQTVHGVWAYLSNKDWFSQALPVVASVADDGKTTISFVIGAIASAILVFRTYRRPDIRQWSDDVAGELAKVKWPTKKEVYNSTVIVIAASAIATVYLALLDRLWGFITNLIYGDGS
jgi:preprotein translocase subunit SecE